MKISQPPDIPKHIKNMANFKPPPDLENFVKE